MEFLGIDPSDFKRRFVTMRWGSPSFAERSNGHCVFYDAGSARCLIYAVRPEQCRSFPFWPELLQSRAAWDAEARRCPGMNEGPLRSAAEIEEWTRSARNWLAAREEDRENPEAD